MKTSIPLFLNLQPSTLGDEGLPHPLSRPAPLVFDLFLAWTGSMSGIWSELWVAGSLDDFKFGFLLVPQCRRRQGK